ncbi:hypothetical protein IFR04_015666 [Cadophora malorum]|uniref:Uncharacterized protein n=1 Tax=Cadophora malorum TaxID=108018 RepID=A0A8H7SYI8_9HELO|nr:hypothetical protein IFR04_015666 [Cadophora malorum]
MSSLNQDEVRALEDDRVLLSGTINGKRKVSAALLSPPSTQGSLSSGSSSSASVRVRGLNTAQAPFDLPESHESVAAIEWCGFTRTKAGDIFARWSARPDPEHNPDGVLEFMIGEINQLNILPLIQVPAEQAMTALGVSDELKNVLTSPIYRRIFLSETLHYWLEDTIRGRHTSLQILQKKLKIRGAQTVARRKGGKRAKILGAFDANPSTEASSSSSSSALPTQPQQMGSAVSNIQSDALPTSYVSVDHPPSILSGHYVLYKGKSSAELLSERFIREDGSINMGAIESMKGEDFNQRRGAWKGTSEGNPPDRLEEFWKPGEAQMIEGHICGRSPNIIPKIPKQDVQTRLSENDLLYNGSRKATQTVFVDEEAVERLGELIRGKIFIEIFPAQQSPDIA